MDEIKAVEEQLKKLLSDYYDNVNPDSNLQVFYDGRCWGFIDDGNFNEIGTFEKLVQWVANRCAESQN